MVVFKPSDILRSIRTPFCLPPKNWWIREDKQPLKPPKIANSILPNTPGDLTTLKSPLLSPRWTCIEPCDTVFRGHLVNDHHAFLMTLGRVPYKQLVTCPCYQPFLWDIFTERNVNRIRSHHRFRKTIPPPTGTVRTEPTKLEYLFLGCGLLDSFWGGSNFLGSKQLQSQLPTSSRKLTFANSPSLEKNLGLLQT